MILNKDDGWKYSRQLTVFLPELDEVAFAVKPFIDSKIDHCVIRRNSDGFYAVFVEPIIYDEDDRAKLLKERHRLEIVEEVEVVQL